MRPYHYKRPSRSVSKFFLPVWHGAADQSVNCRSIELDWPFLTSDLSGLLVASPYLAGNNSLGGGGGRLLSFRASSMLTGCVEAGGTSVFRTSTVYWPGIAPGESSVIRS